MAGGPNATIVPCVCCAEAADRTYDGLETDRYRCRFCGLEFAICFDEALGGGGPLQEPLDPLPAEYAEVIRRAWRERHDRQE